MITHGLLGKVAQLVGTGLTRKSKVYDPSKTKVNISGLNIDGIVELSLSANQNTKTIKGVSREYYAYHTVFEDMSLTLTVLPTANCIDPLLSLGLQQNLQKGWFYLSLWDNGRFVGRYKAHIINEGEMTVSMPEAGNRTFVFGLFESPIPIQTDSLSQPMSLFLSEQ